MTGKMWRRALVPAAAVTLAAAVGTSIPLRANQGPALIVEAGHITYPQQLQKLATDPAGLGVFGSEIVFPQFVLSGGTSTIETYDTQSNSVQGQAVPQSVQGQFAYAVAADEKSGTLWIGGERSLVAFNAASRTVQSFALPSVAYPYQAPWEGGPGGAGGMPNVLGLAVGPDGDVWITRDHDSGLTRFDPKSQTFSQYALPSGVVPKYVAVIGSGVIAVNVYHTDNPHYMLAGGNLDTGFITLDVASGRTTFTPSETVGLAESGAGGLVRLTEGRIELDNTATGTRSPLASAGGRSMYPGFAVSDRDGSTWVANGSEVDHITGTAGLAYPVPLETVGKPIEGGPSGGQVSLYPDVSAVAASPDGGAWFVASGYDSIGHVSP